MTPREQIVVPDRLRVAYCGPIAPKGRPARGGYEAANRRIVDDLRDRGIEVREYPYAVPGGSTPIKTIGYLAGFARIAAQLVNDRARWDILHLTPLYKQFLYPEAVLCRVAWMLGKRVVLDIRAGAFLHYYAGRGRLYQATIDHLIRRADVIAVEGEEYLPFATARHRGHVLYLPNYVSAVPVAPQPGDSQPSPVRLVYLGRVVSQKGIETAIGTLAALMARGVDARLEVIGTGDPDYIGALKAACHGLPVVWVGALPPSKVAEHMCGAHLFLFPTDHLSEGHSNALTEAMAQGLVPICSDNGFNRSVVGDAGRILPASAVAEDYARAIVEIGTGPHWRTLSQRAHHRVAERFTSDVVLPALIQSYRATAARIG